MVVDWGEGGSARHGLAGEAAGPVEEEESAEVLIHHPEVFVEGEDDAVVHIDSALVEGVEFGREVALDAVVVVGAAAAADEGGADDGEEGKGGDSEGRTDGGHGCSLGRAAAGPGWVLRGGCTGSGNARQPVGKAIRGGRGRGCGGSGSDERGTMSDGKGRLKVCLTETQGEG